MRNLIILFLFICSTSFAQQEIVEKANAFLQSLPEPLRKTAQYPLRNEERFHWNFVPTQRNGPSFRDFNAQQKQAALALLRASVSADGYTKATAIVALENVLMVIERQAPDNHYRDPLNYHLTLFGKPSMDEPWGWRFEGHHVAFNFAFDKGTIVSSTPSFLGSNPGIVREGSDKGKEVLKQETDLGFALVNSLTADQLKIARIAEDAPAEIITGNRRKGELLSPGGLKYSDMTAAQQKQLIALLNIYVSNYQLGFAKTLMAKITKAGIENLSFAWAGSLKPGVGQYYRIQGPMLLIEYDNIQNNANHVHTTVRDLTNDFAEDILREHYLAEHHN